MNREDAIRLCRYVAAACPQQRFDSYTPNVWADIFENVPNTLDECRQAVVAIKQRQMFVDPSEIIAEVRRVRNERLDEGEKFLDPPSGLDGPAYKDWLIRERRRIADGGTGPRALEAS